MLPHYRVDLLSALQQEFSKQGVDFTVITGTNAGKKSVKEIESTSFKLIRNNTVGVTVTKLEIQWQKGLINSVRKYKPDSVVVLYHAGKLNHNLLLLYLQLKKTPYVLWGSGSGDRRTDLSALQRKMKALFKYLFIKNSHSYLTYGTKFKDQLISQGYPEKRIFVAQNTLNVEDIYTQHSSFLKDQKPNGIVKFLFVGVIFANKRLDTALEAFGRLAKKGFHFQFDVIGGGEIVEDLKSQARELQIENNVTFHGPKYKDELADFFRKADVFLLPGTGGLAVNEAMAYSLPVITTPGDGTAYDLIENGQNGFILDFDYEVHDLERKISHFIEIPRSELLEMGNKSLSIIKQKATLSNMVRQIVKSVSS